MQKYIDKNTDTNETQKISFMIYICIVDIMENEKSFNYQVVLKPKDIKFTKCQIPSRFDNGTCLKDLLDDVKSGKVLCKDISAAEVVWDMDRWEWYTLSNRRLWIFKELEKAGKISFITMSRVETVNDGWRSTDSTPEFFSEAELYEPNWDITIDTITKPNGTNSIMAEELQKSTTVDESAKKKNDSVVQNGEHNNENQDKENNKKRRQLSEKSDEDEWVEKVIEKKRNKSFSRDDKNLSLSDSRQSLFSNTSSCSSISRSQRKIDKQYGLSGYGSYNKYKTEYLDKVKADKKSILKKYKPYQVSSSRSSLSRSSSYGKLSGSSKSYSTNSVYTTESFTSIRESRRSSFSEENSTYTTTTSLERQTRRMRLYSDDIEEFKGRSKEIVPHQTSRNSLVGSVVPSGAIKLADLYAMWQKRRLSYLRSSRLAITNGVASGYNCGLCYKKFETIVDLQQHCEALLHYACITCGKFFSTYASLGQHCQQLSHQKD